ncbi:MULTISPECIES: CS1-pili formation C-terminal domain-containing protein [Gibbsiella]|uniref:TcfC E-set like domain-containing protein n=1 Tax=Gibbsiella dentisursi TaxID=796890 RepID=A0ABP7MB53_9GAMM|nr:TcfC E-set like domain-containing protein [Gibbsiella quercinecans]
MYEYRIYLAGFLAIMFSAGVYADELVISNNRLLPAQLIMALQQGVTIPVYVELRDDEKLHTTKESKKAKRQQIAQAILTINDQKEIQLQSIELTPSPSDNLRQTELSPKIKQEIEKLAGRSFSKTGELAITDGNVLLLDFTNFNIALKIRPNSIVASHLQATNTLGPSTSRSLTNVLDYNFGSYSNKYKSEKSTSLAYLTLDNWLSWREHHLNLNGSWYGIGSSSSSSHLYRSVYERDYNGYRFSAGKTTTWSSQGLTSFTALSGSNMYGVSFSNAASSEYVEKVYSLTPVLVFLPSAGEVHITRDGNLIDIQSFGMGSFEVDTSRFPYGTYNVDVEVVVNGRTVSKQSALINKPVSPLMMKAQNLKWQFFGGTLDYKDRHYSKTESNSYDDYGTKSTWYAGGSAAKSFGLLDGVALKGSVYGFRNTGVFESELSANVYKNLRVSQQVMAASDNSNELLTTASAELPWRVGNVWVNYDKRTIGDKLNIQPRKNGSYGVSLTLSQYLPHAGTISYSHTKDWYNQTIYNTFSYNTTLLQNKYVTLGIRAGIQRYYYDENDYKGSSEKFIAFDMSLPLATWLSMGASYESGDTSLVVSARKHFDNSAITSTGLSYSKRMSGTSDLVDDYSLSGNMGYDTRYSKGTVSVAHGEMGSTTASLTSQGSVAWSGTNLIASKLKENSGVILKTGIDGAGEMNAKINGRTYKFGTGTNFVALPAYARYHIELMNDTNSEDLFDIRKGKVSEAVLYPGNVQIETPEIKRMVTVFARVLMPDGSIAANKKIHNHIGKTVTDDKGEFAMDIDTRYPEILLQDENGKVCKANLNMKSAHGAAWMGDVQCKFVGVPLADRGNSIIGQDKVQG